MPPALGTTLVRTPLWAYSADCEEVSKTTSVTIASLVTPPTPAPHSLRPWSCPPVLTPSMAGWPSRGSEPCRLGRLL